MALCEFELTVLRQLADPNAPSEVISGAAFNEAFEALKSAGLIDSSGRVTAVGWAWVPVMPEGETRPSQHDATLRSSSSGLTRGPMPELAKGGAA